jgi:PIN domain nuclease of toxin-antitoxin system
MRLLLDTHVLLWWLDDPAKISDAVESAIRSQENEVFVSAATVWEISIKKALGKLDAPDNLDAVLRECQFSPLPVTIEHALAVKHLPFYHHDPFDRMLIAQATVEGLVLATRDSEVLRYAGPFLLA